MDVLALIILATSLLAAPPGTSRTFKRYAYPALGFAAEFPAPPQEQSMDRSADTDAGTFLIKATTSSAGVQGVAFQITVTTFPSQLATTLRLHPQDSLIGTRDGMVSTLRGRLESSSEIHLDTNPGLSFVVNHEINGARFRTSVRQFLVGTRSYGIQVVEPRPGRPSPDRDRFLSSLKLL